MEFFGDLLYFLKLYVFLLKLNYLSSFAIDNIKVPYHYSYWYNNSTRSLFIIEIILIKFVALITVHPVHR